MNLQLPECLNGIVGAEGFLKRPSIWNPILKIGSTPNTIQCSSSKEIIDEFLFLQLHGITYGQMKSLLGAPQWRQILRVQVTSRATESISTTVQ